MQTQDDRGSVTAEYAVLLPAAALVLVGSITAGAALWQQIRLEEAAAAWSSPRATWRAAAAASTTVQRLAGDGAQLTAHSTDGWVSVRVVHPPPGPLDWWGDWMLEATAHAPDQWTVAPGGAP